MPLPRRAVAQPWHSRHSEPVAAHGMGAAVLSAGDRAGKPDGPPIADEAQSPARDRFGSCLGSADIRSLIWLKNNSPPGEIVACRRAAGSIGFENLVSSSDHRLVSVARLRPDNKSTSRAAARCTTQDATGN